MYRKAKYITLIAGLTFFILFGCQQNQDPLKDDDLAKSIEDFKNRKIYTKLDEETLKQINDAQLEQAIIDYIYHKIGENYEKEYKIVTNLPKGYQAIYTTWWVEAEVNNGGFNQYFWNSSGQFALEAVEGFKEIGAVKTAKLMEKAIAISIKERPLMEKLREKGTIEAFSESYDHTELGALDEEFYKSEEDLSSLRIKYIRSNPKLFIGD